MWCETTDGPHLSFSKRPLLLCWTCGRIWLLLCPPLAETRSIPDVTGSQQVFPVHNELSIHGESRKWAGEGYRQVGTDQGSDKVSRFKGRGFLPGKCYRGWKARREAALTTLPGEKKGAGILLNSICLWGRSWEWCHTRVDSIPVRVVKLRWTPPKKEKLSYAFYQLKTTQKRGVMRKTPSDLLWQKWDRTANKQNVINDPPSSRGWGGTFKLPNGKFDFRGHFSLNFRLTGWLMVVSGHSDITIGCGYRCYRIFFWPYLSSRRSTQRILTYSWVVIHCLKDIWKRKKKRLTEIVGRKKKRMTSDSMISELKEFCILWRI